MSDDPIIQRMLLGPAPARNNWNDASLVKFAKPITIGIILESGRSHAGTSERNVNVEESDTSDEDETTGITDKVNSRLVKLDPHSPYFIKTKCVDETNLHRRIIEMLRTTIPPKLWEFEGKVYFQEALAKQITRKEVKQLKDKFSRLFIQRRSSKFGLCAIRREILQQGLDELIRQALMVSPERGLALIRIKNEFELSSLAYNTTASQAVYYKHVPDALKKGDLQELRNKYDELDSEVIELKKKIIKLEKLIEELTTTVTDSDRARHLIHNHRKLQFERNITQMRLHKKALESWGEEYLKEQNSANEKKSKVKMAN